MFPMGPPIVELLEIRGEVRSRMDLNPVIQRLGKTCQRVFCLEARQEGSEYSDDRRWSIIFPSNINLYSDVGMEGMALNFRLSSGV